MSNYNSCVDRYITAAMDAGLTEDEAHAVRRDAERVSTWDEHECNGVIQWAEAGQVDHRGRKLSAGRPYWVTGQDTPNGPPAGRWTLRPDNYTPAMARVSAIAAAHGLILEYNGDPRGWPFKFVMPNGRDFSPPIRW